MPFFIILFSLLFPERNFTPGLMLGNHLALKENPQSIFYQPALIPEKNSFSLSYSLPFEGLNLKYFESALSLKIMKYFSMGIGFSHFGEEIYREQIFSLGSRYKNRYFSMGFSFKVLNLYIKDIINEYQPSFDVGVVINVYENIKVGGFLRNVYKKEEYKKDIPSLFALSLGVLSKSLNFYFDLISEEFHPFTYSAGFDIKLTSFLSLKGSMRSEEKIFGLGFGIEKGIVKIESFYKIHSLLGGGYSIGVYLKK